MKKWTFSTPEGRCVPYTYGGCRGTQNLFSRCALISSFCDRNVIRGEFDALTFVKRLEYFLILEISNKYDWQIVEVISNVMTTARLNVLHDARQSQNPAPRSALSLFNLDRWVFSSYRVLFFNCFAQSSVLKRKTSFNHPGTFVHREFHGTESLIGCSSLFILVLKIGRNS